MRDVINVLMTGAGAPGGPGILKALKMESRLRVQVADVNPLASGSLLHDKSHVIPSATSPTFIDDMLALCLAEEIDVLFPLVTAELFKLAEHKKRFKEHGVIVLACDYASMLVLNDKGALLQHLYCKQVPHPNFKIINNVGELSEAVSLLGYPDQPVVIKPSRGNGSRGIRILDAAVDQYDLLFNHKPNSLYSSMDFVLHSIGDQPIPEMVVSEYLPGPELTIDTVIRDGKIIELLVRTRDTMRSGISTSGRFQKLPSVENYINMIVDSFDPGSLEGAVGFQVKQNKSGDYLILESNPRIQGTSVAGIGCGVNLPALAVFSALGIELDYVKDLDVGFCRFYDEVFYAT